MKAPQPYRLFRSAAQGVFAVLLLGAAACGRAPAPEPSPDAPPVVATVAGEAVPAEAFRTRYVDHLLATGVPDTPARRRAFLDRLVATYLVAADARAAGIEADPAYRHRRDVVEQKVLLETLARQALYDTLQVTEAARADLFVRMNTTLTARHLYARTREQADRLYARLQAGASFEELAREVFADTTLARNGGSVGSFSFDEMDPAFEDAAYALAVGEVSPPVRTTLGYSIIQLQDRFTKPLLTETEYAAKRDDLDRFVRRRKQQAARTAYLQAVEDELDVSFHAPATGALLDRIGGAKVAPDDAEGAWLDEPLVSWTDSGRRRTWTVADFRERASYTSDRQRARVDGRVALEDFVRGLVLRDVLLDRAEALAEPAVVEAAVRREMDAWIWDDTRARFAERIDLSPDTLRAYFEAHRADFVLPPEVHVREILTETRAEAEALKARLAGQAPGDAPGDAPEDVPPGAFEALARAHSVRPGAAATGGELGYLHRAQLGVLAGPVFAAAEGDLLGPLEIAGRYALLRIGPRRAARPAGFEDVRASIEARLRQDRADTAFEAYVEGLRGRYDVRIVPDAAASMSLISPSPS